MFEPLLLLPLAVLLAWPLGRYAAAVMRAAPMRGDRLFAGTERTLYRLLGVAPASGMDWRGYVRAFLLSNLVVGAIVWLILLCQAWLPLNPDGVPNLRWDTALHTMVSFLTNTNQQHYSGQAQLSYFAQMSAIVGLQVITPMMGLALAVATLRALFPPASAQATAASTVGNYWVDVIRASLRLMLPLCLLWALLLGSQGVPATLAAGPLATPVEQGSALAGQKIPLGPVAPMVAAKQLGSNGGGWYGPNSAVALENPTPLSNLIEMLGIVLIPIALVFMVGAFTGRRRLAALIFGSMLLMSLLSTAAALWTESHAPGTALAAMEGKEVRFGGAASALWAALTTQVNNGSVNAMHDSLAPLTGLVALVNMLVNAIWGGVGCGLQQFMVYLLLAIFLAGLMTGRTPELYGRKLEAAEVRLLALLVVLQPVVVLGFTAITLALPGLAGNSNPGFHGISQVFYEYTSAFANNGSGFEGLADATPWWNLSCTLVLILGRYPALIVPLVIAARLAGKRQAPATSGTLPIETPTFAFTLVAVIGLLTVLQFLPALVLGPIGEHLALNAPQGVP